MLKVANPTPGGGVASRNEMGIHWGRCFDLGKEIAMSRSYLVAINHRQVQRRDNSSILVKFRIAGAMALMLVVVIGLSSSMPNPLRASQKPQAGPKPQPEVA
jgi:hypothetical protein